MTKSVKGVELEFASAPIGAVTGMERDVVREAEWSESKRSVRLRSDASVSRRGLLNRALCASVRRARDCGWR